VWWLQIDVAKTRHFPCELEAGHVFLGIAKEPTAPTAMVSTAGTMPTSLLKLLKKAGIGSSGGGNFYEVTEPAKISAIWERIRVLLETHL
jgi:hypothetical protein